MKENILTAFEANAKKFPEKVAVYHNAESITFGELHTKVLALAEHLRTVTGAVQNRPICIFLPKSIRLIIGATATMYSGNIFNNLDVKTPLARIEKILHTLEPVAIVSAGKLADSIATIAECPVVDLDTADWQSATLPAEVLTARLTSIVDTTPFGIVNTSGSTGTPKGVLLTYGGFWDFTGWALREFGLGNDTVVGVMSSTVFDVYIFENCLMLVGGATLALLDMQLAMFPVKLMEECQAKQVNFLYWVPTVLASVAKFDLLDKYRLPLQTVFYGGELMPTIWLNKWRRAYPDVTFANLYGPCEITIACIVYVSDRDLSDDEPVPIGYARDNVQALLLDDDNNLCPPGVEGEICIGGTQIALGYYNNPERSAEVFVQNPLNHSYHERIYRTGDVGVINERGEMLFLGRRDSLVKIHGNRVELGEIEHVAVDVLKAVNSCAIVYDHERSKMVMFYEDNDKITDMDLRKALGSQLPRYMVPNEYVALPQMPHNPNGKIDRNLLKTKVKEGKY